MTANARAKIALQIKMYTFDVLPVPLAVTNFNHVNNHSSIIAIRIQSTSATILN